MSSAKCWSFCSPPFCCQPWNFRENLVHKMAADVQLLVSPGHQQPMAGQVICSLNLGRVKETLAWWLPRGSISTTCAISVFEMMGNYNIKWWKMVICFYFFSEQFGTYQVKVYKCLPKMSDIHPKPWSIYCVGPGPASNWSEVPLGVPCGACLMSGPGYAMTPPTPRGPPPSRGLIRKHNWARYSKT